MFLASRFRSSSHCARFLKISAAGAFLVGSLCKLSPSLGAEPSPSAVPGSPPAPPSVPVVPAPLDAPAPVVPTPPVPLHIVDALVPGGGASRAEPATVRVLVTVSSSGAVTDAAVTDATAPDLDAAALSAVRQWTFAPALRNGTPVASRIVVPFRFPASPPVAPPLRAKTTPEGTPAERPAVVANPAKLAPEGSSPKAEPIEVEVRGRRLPPARSISDFTIDRELVAAAPHRDAGELLAAAPGVYVARSEGDAVAQEIVLRGFDAAHGQDIELTVNGWLPLNQPSHVHGQGYADLNFLLPEVVRSVRVVEGVYDPRQGDFAVAGSVDFSLGVAERGYQSRSSIGSFGSFRQFVSWAPAGESDETFGAVAIRRSDGFGMNRGGLSGTALGQFAFEGPGGFHGVALVAGYGGRASLAGVLRRDDVDAGRVGFYDSYRDPSANAQSASASRALAGVKLERTGAAGEQTSLSAWLGWVDFRARENFTGYLQRSRVNPTWMGRGDLIEQANQDFGLGARAEHRTARFSPLEWLTGQVEFGLSWTAHRIEQQQNLLQAPLNETWDRRVAAAIRQLDIGIYADADLRLTRFLRLRGGVRADVLTFDVDDALGNVPSTFKKATHLAGYRRTAVGVAVGPRVTLEGLPTTWLGVSASYGEGYRSPQALQLAEGDSAPFTKVRGFEGGVNVHPWGERLKVTAAGYATFLSSDLAFDPGEGALERIGSTTRRGFVTHAVVRPWDWFLGSVSVTYVRATLDAPPPASAANPVPPFREGQLLPYVPPVVVRADTSVQRVVASLGGFPLKGRIGAGFSFLSSRPLPYGRFAEPVALLDVSASSQWRSVELQVDVFNVIGSRYAATEYSFASDWRTTELPSLLPARQFSAGAPRTALVSLGLSY